MSTRRAGGSLIAFGLVILAGWAAASLIFGTLMIDAAAMALVGLGVALGRGSKRAVPWARALSGAYALASVLAALAVGLDVAELLPWPLPIAPERSLGILAIVLAWSLLNLYLLRKP